MKTGYREVAKQILENGGSLDYHVWTFYEKGITCPDGCCEDGFKDVEETLDRIEHLCENNWNEVRYHD